VLHDRRQCKLLECFAIMYIGVAGWRMNPSHLAMEGLRHCLSHCSTGMWEYVALPYNLAAASAI
jgi:hypothetical protein